VSGFLLDTHVFFWATIDSPHLRSDHRHLIASTTEPLFVSAATVWEIATKARLGKWPEATVLLPDIGAKAIEYAMELLPITPAQAERAGSLPTPHRDPFDLMLAAQALDRELTILTVDPAFAVMNCRVM
jgi:PIN domain nuclease of toxin-antitoxin system